MDKTIGNIKTSKNLDLIRLPKETNKLRDDNLDLIWLLKKSKRLKRARTSENGSPSHTKNLKPKQFRLASEQQKYIYIKKKKTLERKEFSQKRNSEKGKGKSSKERRETRSVSLLRWLFGWLSLFF